MSGAQKRTAAARAAAIAEIRRMLDQAQSDMRAKAGDDGMAMTVRLMFGTCVAALDAVEAEIAAGHPPDEILIRAIDALAWVTVNVVIAITGREHLADTVGSVADLQRATMRALAARVEKKPVSTGETGS